jgi:hypothetical protein
MHWIEQADTGPVWKWLIDGLFNGYPKGAEATSFFATRLFASSRPVNTVNLVFLPLGVAGIASICRSLGASLWSTTAAAFAFALVPLGVSQGVTTYVDAAFADSVAALAAAIVVVISPLARGLVPLRALVTFGCALGLSASTKSTGVVAAVIAFVLIGAAVALGIVRNPPASRRRIAKRAAAFACGSVALGAASPAIGQ